MICWVCSVFLLVLLRLFAVSVAVDIAFLSQLLGIVLGAGAAGAPALAVAVHDDAVAPAPAPPPHPHPPAPPSTPPPPATLLLYTESFS